MYNFNRNYNHEHYGNTHTKCSTAVCILRQIDRGRLETVKVKQLGQCGYQLICTLHGIVLPYPRLATVRNCFNEILQRLLYVDL